MKVLRCIPPLKLEELVIGQYVADKAGKHKGYKEDDGVPKDSTCPTYAVAILHIENERWAGVPFILKCGKGFLFALFAFCFPFTPLSLLLLPSRSFPFPHPFYFDLPFYLSLRSPFPFLITDWGVINSVE